MQFLSQKALDKWLLFSRTDERDAESGKIKVLKRKTRKTRAVARTKRRRTTTICCREAKYKEVFIGQLIHIFELLKKASKILNINTTSKFLRLLIIY